MPRKPRKPPPTHVTRDDFNHDDDDDSNCGGNKHKQRVGALLIVLGCFAIVGLVPEWYKVSQLSSFRSLQFQFTKRDTTNQTLKDTTNLYPNTKVESLWVDYHDFPLINNRSSKLIFPSEDEWLLSSPLPTQHQEAKTDHHSGSSIPKLLHKVFFSRNGKFPQGFFANNNNNNSSSTVSNYETNNNNNNNKSTNDNDGGIIDMESLQKAHKSWHDFNPNFMIRYYNLHLARVYLRRYFHPIFLRAFDCIEAFAGKADFFRYVVVYREGGFYSDWKQVCLVDGLLDQMASDNCTWFSFIDLKLNGDAVQNGFFGSIPQHPVLAESIRSIFFNIQHKIDENDATDDVMWLTGPRLLGAAVKKLNLQVGVDGVKMGISRYNYRIQQHGFFYQSKFIVSSKCHGCGLSQNWTNGNNYHEKFQNNEFFCPDAESLLATTTSVDH